MPGRHGLEPVHIVGNSPNIRQALEGANRHDLRTWGITGYDGGRLRRISGDSLRVPLDDMSMVESIHLVLFHWILNDVYARINCVGRNAPAETREAG